ncbi:hypothetical protein [Chryseobacterium sp. BLS98]|uniref:hypothetical protein n=1 Tax=Chryseobacterium sp. BLS98 TaxID=885586 RepID=UPI000A80EDC7|nr:hypothetical protein [Chryseobacterium sp. BLS98]
MMKILVLSTLGILLCSTNTKAQVGINTPTPNSTLVVEGSYEGAYKNITANTNLTIQDQYLTVTGSSAVNITLPDGTVTNSFSGRIYHVKNNSTQDVTLSGFGGTQLIRITAAGNAPSYTIPSGSYAEIIKNEQSDAAVPLWELSFFGIPTPPNIKALTYIKKTVTPIDGSTPTNSTVNIGNISLRFNGTSSNAANIEYNVSVANHVTILYHKAGSGGASLEEWGRQASLANTWYSFTGENGNATRDINPNNRDIGYALIILHNTKEVYRVTANVNGDISSSGGVPSVASSVTLFVEKLD